ncbi:MAG: hypothetical protein KGL39_20350 [Patescibacteria group bacterium]|nr:hypothetical protein [Patescibacteria group bacterium]
MAVTINVTTVDTTQQGIIVEGTLALSGNYTTGGDTVNFSTVPEIAANTGPRGLVEIDEQPANGSTPSGYGLYLIAGTTLANWLLYITTTFGQPPTQLGAGAYPAALQNATIQFRAFFPFGE